MSLTPSATPTAPATATPTATVTAMATRTPFPPSPLKTAIATATRTATPTASASPMAATATPSQTASPTPTRTPTNSGPGTTVGGPLCDDTTWQAAKSPYIASSSVIVGGSDFCDGAGVNATLTIEPGVEIRFADSRFLDISGTLIARGTDQAPILFTSNRTSKAPGDWGGIRFRGSSQSAGFDSSGNYIGGSIMQNCVVEYAKDTASLSGAIGTSAAAPFFDKLTARNNASTAIYATNVGDFRIRHSHLVGNTGTGLFVNGATHIEVTEVTAANNTGDGVDAYCNNSGNASVTNLTATANGGTGLLVYSCGGGISDSLLATNSVGGLFYGGSGLLVEHSTFASNTTGVSCFQVSVQNSIVRDNSGAGFLSNGSNTNCVIRGSCVVDTGGSGLLGVLTAQSNTLVRSIVSATNGNILDHNNLIEGVSGTSVRVLSPNSGGPAPVRNNWWGTTDSAAISAAITDCFDDGSLGCAPFNPVATGPIPGAPDIDDCAKGILTPTAP